MDTQYYNPRQSKLMEWVGLGIPAGSVFGIRIRLHLLLVISWIVIWTSYSGYGLSLGYHAALSAATAAIVFGSILLHELGHCYGAFKVGGGASQIILWPLGGLAVVSGVEKGPKSELIVTILGPAVSVALWILFSALHWAAAKAGVHDFIAYFLQLAGYFNGAIAIFNMAVPLFPMDCSRVVRSVLSFRYNPNKVTYWLTTCGMCLGGVIFLLSFFDAGWLSGPFIGLIGIIGALTSWQERKRCQMMDVYVDGPWYWRDAMWRSETAPGRKPIMEEIRSAAGSLLKTKKKPRSPARVIDATAPNTVRETLEADLKEAVASEDFLRAANLRDEIKKL
jgi:Zn-dependent protease